RALAMRRYVERDLRRRRLEVCTEVGCLHRPHALAIQWRIVEQLFREQQRRHYGGGWLQRLKKRGPEDRTPLSSPRKRGPTTPASGIIRRSLCAEFIPAGHVRPCRPDMYRSPGYPRGAADSGRP